MSYLLIALASVIGILVGALKIQGGRLHRAQIQLLSQSISMGQDVKDRSVVMAKDRLHAALAEYYKAPK